MPIFEYRCAECRTEFERIVVSSKSEVNCPKCGSKKTEKLLSSFAVSGSTRSSGFSGPSGCGPRGGT